MSNVAFNRCVSVYFPKLFQQVEALSSHTYTVCEQFTAIATDSDRNVFQPGNFTCPGMILCFTHHWTYASFSCILCNFNVKKETCDDRLTKG